MPNPVHVAAVAAVNNLTPEQSARLVGENIQELTASATALLAETPVTPTFTPSDMDADRQPDGSGTAPTGVEAGAAEYRKRHGLDENGRRPARKPVPTDGSNAFREPGYEMNR